MDAPFVLVLSGPPGAGKSTVAQLVSRKCEPAVCLESDWFYTTIVTGYIDPWEERSNEQNRSVLRAAFAAANRFATGGYGVVLEGVVGPWHLDLIDKELGGLDVPVIYIVLRPDLDVCLTRAMGRAGEQPRVAGNPPLTAEGPLRALWHRFSDLGPYEAHALDTTELTAQAAATLVADMVSSGRSHLALE